MKSYEFVNLIYNTESRDPNNLRIETNIVKAKSKTLALQQHFYNKMPQLQLLHSTIKINILKKSK